MLPALERLAEDTQRRSASAPRILVLTPTRELAQQVTEAAITYGKFMRQVRITAHGSAGCTTRPVV
jgi:superfamily II DNA/RNA helicase